MIQSEQDWTNTLPEIHIRKSDSPWSVGPISTPNWNHCVAG